MYVLVTFDLKGLKTPGRRDKFYKALEDFGWSEEDEKLSTTFELLFSDDLSKDDIIKKVKSDLTKASKKSGITHLETTFSISEEKPERFTYKGSSKLSEIIWNYN